MLHMILLLVLIGVILYLLKNVLDPTVKKVIIVILLLAVCLWLADGFGLIDASSVHFKSHFFK